MTINLKAAKTLNLQIPSTLLALEKCSLCDFLILTRLRHKSDVNPAAEQAPVCYSLFGSTGGTG